jgi:hypothetical protein
MKPSMLIAVSAAWLLIAAPLPAQTIQIGSGVVCQPATAADASRLDYGRGHATNVSAVGQIATVVCALPTVAPGQAMVRATAYFSDPARHWPRAKCSFMNAAPGGMSWWARIAPLSPTSTIGSATIDVDPFVSVPHAVNCSVHPGQSLYAVETELEPLG